MPDEVRPLVKELNLLFDRVHTAFDAQKSFVANAAHELRSPLTALKLQAQALARVTDEPARQVAIERLNQGIDRAVQLMNQLLVLARQEHPQGEDGPKWQAVDLQALVHQAVAEQLPQAQTRSIDLGCDLGSSTSDSDTVQGDSDALLILLRNLLDNALKYTPAGGRVDIGLATNGGAVQLHVDDSGPGIAPAERERVFERFYRSPDVTASGSGLGLAIALAIARRHHASLTLDQSPSLGGLRVAVQFKTHLS